MPGIGEELAIGVDWADLMAPYTPEVAAWLHVLPGFSWL